MSSSLRTRIFVILGILFLALNLRGPFTSLAPVLSQVMKDLNLSSSAAGFLTALPLLSFAVFSPLVTKIPRKVGLEPSLILAMFLVAVGVVLRSWGMVTTLYIGTILIGIGIAIGNVLLPVVVKVNFPARIAIITSLYTFTMGIGSTLSASLMVPFSNITFLGSTGWSLALMMNLIFPALALLIWLPKLKQDPAKVVMREQAEGLSMLSLLTSRVAWQVTLALGLNSFTFYSLAGWLPKILNDLGYSEIDAGYIYGFLQFSTMVPGLLLLPLLSKKQIQRTLITLCTFSGVIGILGLLYFPAIAVFWVGLFGFANCATFIIALSFIGLRTANARQAASLSGMAQGIGYGLAAVGPTLIGKTHALTQSWTIPLLLIACAGFACTCFASLAARNRKV